jgi:glyoxylase-like metal-dependent hydrolase (beta-lactamase superfamily II)
MQAIPNTKNVVVLMILCCAAVMAQDSTERAFIVMPVGRGVWAAISNPKSKSPSGVNAGIVIGDDSVAVIDTFVSADSKGELNTDGAGQLLDEIRKLTTLPVKYVVNTHYHPDHTGGNNVFAGTGAVVLAQRNVRSWIHTENLKFFGSAIQPSQKAFVEALPAPQVVYDEGLDLYLGSRQLQIRTYHGHTGSDSVVLIPDARIVFTGDLFWQRTLPNLIDASTKPWLETLDTFERNWPEYTFVPGHGDVGTAQDVAAFREYLATIRAAVADAQTQGKAGTALVEFVMSELKEKYGEWNFFSYLAQPNILDIDAELRGVKRVPK